MIIGLLYYDVGSFLIPGAWRSDKEVYDLYNKYFTDEEIQENGVLLLRIKVLEVSNE